MAMTIKTDSKLLVSDSGRADKETFMRAGYAALKAVYPELPDLPDFGADEGDGFSIGAIDPANGNYVAALQLPGTDAFAVNLTDKE